MSAPESYQLESLASEADGVKPASPTASIDPANVRWMNQGGRRWEVCKIVTRLIGTLLCGIILILMMAWYGYPSWGTYNVWPWLCLPGALPSFMWDLGEFLTICARHGRGITPKAHIGLELVISILAYIGGGWLAYQLGVQEDNQIGHWPLNLALTECIFMLFSATIHLSLFIRACVERSREIRRRRPRVMYIPETGQTVYVVAKPFPKLPSWKSQTARAQSFPRSPQSPVNSSLRHPFQQLQEEMPPLLPDRPGDPTPTSATFIKRKPLPAGLPARTVLPGDRSRQLRLNMRPPPADYEPSVDELERMRRGDAQPQLILPGDVDIKFATSVTGMTPADASAREGKYRVNMTQMPVILGESSRNGGGGRTRSL
ncbi:hypothetical protein CORC01_00880 [Colletotrichum orchidophilum]|uniref:Uncharacterized protein n=1 Tax=Colletotrichum orchidophilum TaxID=1209926 RepID=A0A1G4BRK0_9PEZI|nr:uncharacterized protein CORC01_00880 [Colletotrichum orchidophilum]OHF04018.1 hypothetical protein CORC01_00880 [Colletotrichum orchidophilum]